MKSAVLYVECQLFARLNGLVASTIIQYGRDPVFDQDTERTPNCKEQGDYIATRQGFGFVK